MTTKISKRLSIEDFVASYNEAVLSIEKVYAAAKDAANASESVGVLGCSEYSLFRDNKDIVERNLTESYWRRAFDVSGIGQYMDAQAKRLFEDGLRGTPPAFTPANLRDTLVTAASNKDEMFTRGLVNLFRRLSGNYKSNSAFEIGRRMVVQYITEPAIMGGLEIAYRAFDEINDLDRVLCTVAGRRFERGQLISEMTTAWKAGNDYVGYGMRIQGYKNGNIHIYLDAQLRKRLNTIIAEYYGLALAA